MKLQNTLLIILFTSLCVACGSSLPDTPCACEDVTREYKDRVDQAIDNIRPYNAYVKKNYESLVNNLLKEVESTEEVLTHCDQIRKESGPCVRDREDKGIWDIGEYVTTTEEYVNFYKTSYTGDWYKDSCQNSIANPEVAFEVLRRIRHKENKNESLTEFEVSIKDSLEKNLINKPLKDPSFLSDTTALFPGMSNK